MNKIIISVLITAIVYSSCSETSKGKLWIIEPATILKSIRNWQVYNRDYLRLSENFTAFDSGLNEISKEQFLKLLSVGNYLPLKLISKDSLAQYELYKLDSSVNEDIRGVIKDFGELEYMHFKMEGKELPNFDVVDLNGNIYNKNTTTGKILILKCWFIKCQACNEEIPILNELVKKTSHAKTFNL